MFCDITASNRDIQVQKSPVHDNEIIILSKNQYEHRVHRADPMQSTHIQNLCTVVCFWSLVGGLGAFGFHKLHGLLFDCLDALWGAMLLLVLQVALEEELDLLRRNTEVDHTIKERPAEEKSPQNVFHHVSH